MRIPLATAATIAFLIIFRGIRPCMYIEGIAQQFRFVLTTAEAVTSFAIREQWERVWDEECPNGPCTSKTQYLRLNLLWTQRLSLVTQCETRRRKRPRPSSQYYSKRWMASAIFSLAYLLEQLGVDREARREVGHTTKFVWKIIGIM